MATINDKVDWRVLLAGVIVVGLLEAYALYLGHNGTYFAIAMVLIGAAIGVTIPNPIIKK